jgi:hypothetical protein
MPQTLADETSRFFDDYNRTFAERDGAAISMFYSVPSVSMRGDKSTHCFRFADLEVQAIGRSVLATLEWQNTRPDGSIVRKWRQSYNLIR